jgi:EAL domain-containing protein (putative c-di-GMP-specific phosphodiesterase class I)
MDAIFSGYLIRPSDISIEITENIAFSDVEKTKSKIIELRKRNIKVYLDDFGKGYSSLTYIKQYPIDYLKIDKSFIDDIIKNRIDQSLVNTMIAVSNYLGIKVVSEGVETKEQLDFLRQIGCHEYQGYYLSKPKPLEMLDIQFKK